MKLPKIKFDPKILDLGFEPSLYFDSEDFLAGRATYKIPGKDVYLLQRDLFGRKDFEEMNLWTLFSPGKCYQVISGEMLSHAVDIDRIIKELVLKIEGLEK